MIKDCMVRVKLKKHYKEHRPISYFGKVSAFTDHWVAVDGRAVMISRAERSGVQVDKHTTRVLIPASNIESIQLLPDTFDYKNLNITTEGQQIRVVVDGKTESFIGELGEG
jgi:hypothetical protein